MSVVVAIKEKNRVYIGADSQVTRGGTRTTLKNPNNYKVWQAPLCENTLMAHVGNVRDGNVVRLISGLVTSYDEFYDAVDYKFVVKNVVPEIIKALKEAHFLKMSDDYIDTMDSSYLFAYMGKLFSIGYDCSVIEVEDYTAIGSGACEAIGSLHTTVGEDPKKRIIKAIKASAANDIYVDYPIIIADTYDEAFYVVTEKNEHNFLNKNDEKKGENKQ